MAYAVSVMTYICTVTTVILSVIFMAYVKFYGL
jgi:hypothetical protein